MPWLQTEENIVCKGELSTPTSHLDQIHFVFQLTGQTKYKIFSTAQIYAQLVIHILLIRMLFCAAHEWFLNLCEVRKTLLHSP